MTSKTNQARAKRGYKLLKYHQRDLLQQTGRVEVGVNSVASLLTEIMHLCDQNELPFGLVIEHAVANHIEEMKGADDYLDNEYNP